MILNEQAFELCESMLQRADRLRISVRTSGSGTRLIDCGIETPGGLEAGRKLAEVCLAGLGRVSFVPAEPELWSGPAVAVTTDHPALACMGSQYAGWQITGEKFFAMGSGPMRAAAAREAVLEKVGAAEKPGVCVGVLETKQFPPDAVCIDLAHKCGVEPGKLTLLVAPTASLAGTVQVVARAVETALHKLFELGFDLGRIVSAYGVAPLPPVAAGDVAAIGLTNDAILYGGEVTLYVTGDDASLEAIGPRVPSGASADYGQPFATIFERYNRDFYRIDPHLFSPAVVTLVNMQTGHTFRYGHTLPRVIHESFDIRQ